MSQEYSRTYSGDPGQLHASLLASSWVLICGERLGPAVLKGQSHRIERGAAKLRWTGGRARRALFCVKISLKRRVHAVGGRGAQRKGPTIVKGLSHEILNGMRWEKAEGARSAARTY